MSTDTERGALAALADEWAAQAAARESRGATTTEQLSRLAALSVFDLPASRDAGGAETSVVELTAILEDLAAGDLAPALILAQHHAALVALRIAGAGGPEERIVRSGDRVTLGLGQGAPPRVTVTTHDTRVTGGLRPIPGPDHVDAIVTVAETENGDGATVVVARGEDGVVLSDAPDLLGLRRSAPTRVRLDDARVREAAGSVDLHDVSAAAEAVLALLTAAVAVGSARGSVDAATRLTRGRTVPRPVPGVSSATQDPLSQVVLGAALVPVDGARALVSEVAGEIDARLSGSGDVSGRHLRLRALTALDVALTTALHQGEEVYEVVGTSGSGNKHGYDRLWRDARTLAAQWTTRPRRRELGRALIGGAA